LYVEIFLLHLAGGSGWHGMTVGRLLDSVSLRDL
jgi:CRISPR/Cas system CSM-associated protein Csm5 (group 7 of RAMP superfamily)